MMGTRMRMMMVCYYIDKHISYKLKYIQKSMKMMSAILMVCFITLISIMIIK